MVFQNSKGAPKNAQFRPSPVVAPKPGVTRESYAEYLAAYGDYVSFLGSLKTDFWRTAGKKVTVSAAFQVLPGATTGAGAGSSRPRMSVGFTSSVAPNAAPTGGKSSAAPEKGKAPADAAEKRARNVRRSLRRKAAKIDREVKNLKVKTELAKARTTYAAALKSQSEITKKSAKPTGKAGQAPPPDKGKGKEPAPGKASGKGPKPPRSPPSDSAGAPGPSQGPEGKPKEQSKKPNRKERRRAIYGPLGLTEKYSARVEKEAVGSSGAVRSSSLEPAGMLGKHHPLPTSLPDKFLNRTPPRTIIDDHGMTRGKLDQMMREMGYDEMQRRPN